jgi:SpoVK/Ycf46/Vps4 family AAA+-type ATPase
VGVPGTGKSLCAKCIGTALNVPTLRLDIGSLFNSLVGEREARTRDALKLAEALAPCVLWVDEIDKGLAGSQGGSGDSGVTKRVFGSIISWMQERKRSVFLVATANDVTGLPPEFLRKGRFDEIFAVDLPSESERKAILTIQLKARKRDPKKFDLDAICALSNTFTGSEIEATLDEALFRAFDQNKQLETQHLLDSTKEIVPLAVTAKEQIENIRAWARSRARFASTQVF